MGPIGPMSVRRLYRYTRPVLGENPFGGHDRPTASWDAVERVAPEAMVAWDATGRDVRTIGVAGSKLPPSSTFLHPVPYVCDDTNRWWVWIDGAWDPWSYEAARSIIGDMTAGWAVIDDSPDSSPTYASEGFTVLPSDYEDPSWEEPPFDVNNPPWGLNVAKERDIVRYSILRRSEGFWSPIRTLTPDRIDDAVGLIRAAYQDLI